MKEFNFLEILNDKEKRLYPLSYKFCKITYVNKKNKKNDLKNKSIIFHKPFSSLFFNEDF